MEEKLQELVVV
jgi:hypothetical protein